ncbi:hypothetical protein GCM10009814_14330 [Lapillicoccus jejuensis]|uniref:Uncharacterized protein n=1 Tax=Lapillicoccus jejuensis TaxID=402171 RepID=A0A542E0V1_9MICO|nr:hypothetical protein FB458_1921 [Lapillicoccus jejuensis]
MRGADGRKHEATLVKLPKVEREDSPAVVEKGSFTFGYCKSCDWTGPARRARDKAVRDAVRHDGACPGKPNVRVGVLDGDPRP